MDLSWLSQEAKALHQVFESLFYPMATVLLLLGVMLEYFKMPLGIVPSIPQLVGRTIIAAIMLHSYPEVANTLSDFTDALGTKLGDVNQLKDFLSRIYDSLANQGGFWVSIKQGVTMVVSFLTYLILYITVYFFSAAAIYVWLLLYIFSPLLCVLFILPATASVTKAMYRAMFEVCAWKIVWAVLSTLLWSYAFTQINKPGAEVNFIVVISLNLIIAASLLFTPMVVNALTSMGISGLAGTALTGIGGAASVFVPGGYAAMAAQHGKRKMMSLGKQGIKGAYKSAFPDDKKGKQKNDDSARSKSSQNLTPPRWHSKVPPPNEPPGFMNKKLEREQKIKSPQKPAPKM